MNGETLLYRQIHPHFIVEGEAQSVAFRPSRKDRCCLSVYDSDKITAEEAWRHFTSTLKLKSGGIMAVTVDECHKMGLKVDPDYKPYPTHVSINFGTSNKSRIRVLSEYLITVACARGWIFGPIPDN